MRHFFCDSLKRFLMVFVATLAFVAPTFAATLPTGYTELEYIESTGTQYIDTGVTISGTDSVEYSTNFAVSDTSYLSQDMQVCGAYSGGNRMYLFGWYQSKFVATEHSGSYDTNKTAHISVSGINANVFYPVHVSIGNGNATLTVNGVSDVNTNQTTVFENNQSLFLFARNSNGNATTFAKVRLKETTIRKNGVTVIDFIPARRESDGVVGMYDTVNNQFYTNAGTGTFTAGPTACPGGTLETHHESGLPVGYTKLDYIESTGTQYIDTGLFLDYTKNFRITGTIMNPESNKRKIIIGNYNTNNNKSFSIEFAAGSQPGLTSDGIRVYFGNVTASYSKSTAALPLNTDIDIDFVYTANTKSFILTCVAGGQIYSLSGSVPDILGQTSDESLSMFLDKRNSPSAITNSLIIKTITVTQDTNNLNFVSSKNSSNTIGMYDLVSGQFFTNQGNGSFVAGNEVSDPIVEQCVGGGIKIATTKYTEDAFANLVTTLNSAITKVTNIVDTTVQQATEIGNLATTKQDRPDTDCPAGRKCLLIMGADNKPHWYLIQE